MNLKLSSLLLVILNRIDLLYIFMCYTKEAKNNLVQIYPTQQIHQSQTVLVGGFSQGQHTQVWEPRPNSWWLQNRSHGVKLRGSLRRLDLHLSHLELGALQPFAQSERRRSWRLSLQTLVVHSVLDGLETQLQPRGQMLGKTRGEKDVSLWMNRLSCIIILHQ